MSELRRVLLDLVAIRMQNHLSQREVARRMGVVQSFVSLLEKGIKRDVYVSTLMRYAEAVGGQVEIQVKKQGEEESDGEPKEE